jgi:hypothetical protein
MIDVLEGASIRLDIADEQAVENLRLSLGVTRAELLDAVALLGPMPNALRAYFASRSKRKAWPAAKRSERAEASAAGRKRRRDAMG